MQIDIRPLNLALDPAARARIAKRARFALERLAARVRRVEIRLADINGPRGGIDKRCRVLVHLDGAPPMLVQEQGDSLPALVDRALDRAGRAVRKRVGQTTQPRYAPRVARLPSPG